MSLDKLIETAKNISDVAPQAYDDVIHPPAQNTGKALGTVTDFFNTLLTPLELLNKTVSLHKEKFLKDYEDKLNKIPPTQQCTPRPEIVGPILEHAKYKITEDTLRERYAKLLSEASNINSQTIPLLSFDNVLDQLSPYEVNLLAHLFSAEPGQYYPSAAIQMSSKTGYTIPYSGITDIAFNNLSCDSISVMISNLARLGIIKIDTMQYVMPETRYNYVSNTPIFIELEAQCARERTETGHSYPKCSIEKHCFYLTEFGKSFVATVIS